MYYVCMANKNCCLNHAESHAVKSIFSNIARRYLQFTFVIHMPPILWERSFVIGGGGGGGWYSVLRPIPLT